MAKTKIVVEMSKAKDTKGAVRFESAAEDAAMRNIYVRKPGGTELGQRVRVTVEAID